MIQRRDVLKIGAAGIAGAALGAANAEAQTPPAAPPPPFDGARVVETAKALATRPFRPPSGDLPDLFANLNAEQYNAIQNRPESVVWAPDTLGFAIEPLHRGFLFSAPMRVNVVEGGVARRLVYSSSDFDFGALRPPADLKDLGFSGFRVLVNSPGGEMRPVAIFQGASFYRAIAQGQVFGARARGLAIKVADTKGEEIPIFREIWIERPTLAQGTLVMHALLDSDSVTGAYRFTLRTGDATIIDTECTLFARVAVESLGVAPMAATYLGGSTDRRRSDDVRPEIHDASGLQMLNGRDEWLWRPLSNRETLQSSAFVDSNPRGFGFLQRDRNFNRFMDDENHWEKRPSLWVEPIGDWGPGAVTLIEVPSDADVNQNMIAFWRPTIGLASGSETSFAYRQFWCWSPPARPPNARVTQSRGGRTPGANAGKRRRFLIEFGDDMFEDENKLREIAPNLGATPGSIVSVRKYVSRATKTVRIVCDLEPGTEQPSEMRLFLEANGKPLSEIWLYRWTP
jgi:glucans biosynthesis protein